MDDNDFLPVRKRNKSLCLVPSRAYEVVMRNLLNINPLVEAYERERAAVSDTAVPTAAPRTRKRSCKTLNDKDPRDSTWYAIYVRNPNLTAKGLKMFRRRFRLPYAEFVKLKDCLLQSPEFSRWHAGKTDPFGVPASPLELMLLGSLRYLGRGLTFDDIEEGTFVGQETHRQFFHTFVTYCSTALYQKYVVGYNNNETISSDRNDYALAGFPGAVGSLDATHISMEKCGSSSFIQHKGFKMSCTTRTYNITVNHRRYITSTTAGAPGSWNDKSVIRFDKLAMDMRDSDMYDGLTFDLACLLFKKRHIDLATYFIFSRLGACK